MSISGLSGFIVYQHYAASSDRLPNIVVHTSFLKNRFDETSTISTI